MNIIEVRELVKRYGDFTAVNGISFEVYEGELFGFLGPNGAGKSTTINMLCTLSRPTSGHATVNGYDVRREPDAVRQSLGLIFQDPSLDERLTGWENLRFHALLYNVPGAVFEQRARELLEMVELTDKARALVRTYSGGMRRRLEIARGLLHHPAVLFLDEPTIGLDPQTRRHIWEYLINLRGQVGLTMFLTTHYMEEAENADRIAIIDHGDIIALDTPAGLKSLMGGDIISVRTDDNARAAARLAEAYAIEPRTGPEGQLIIETAHGDQFIPQIVSALANGDTPVFVQAVDLRRPTLEDVFIKLTGRAIREEEASARDQMRGQMGRRR
ncbi:MAG: ATP-binding cassette domain-containing protein [Chloroflexi bacterium]|jgi:ABC-2 type transport system ATP-binding protein|nr:ATP-binding cassette domain-containing protein [Chloroflexota bacterium]